VANPKLARMQMATDRSANISAPAYTGFIECLTPPFCLVTAVVERLGNQIRRNQAKLEDVTLRSTMTIVLTLVNLD
jgi:hypothetical protein